MTLFGPIAFIPVAPMYPAVRVAEAASITEDVMSASVILTRPLVTHCQFVGLESFPSMRKNDDFEPER